MGRGYFDQGEVVDAKAVRLGKRKPKPENRIPGSVLLRVQLQIPIGVFDPIVSTIIAIDEGSVDVHVEQGSLE